MTYTKYKDTLKHINIINKMNNISILRNNESPFDFKFKDENDNEISFEEIILLIKLFNDIVMNNASQVKNGFFKAIQTIKISY